MKRIIIIVSGFIILFQACLSTDVVEVDIPYQEYIVVQGILEKDSIFSGVRFTKTLSLSEPYNVENAKLTNVVAYLLIDGILTIPIHHTVQGIYKPLYPHKVRKGSTYELFAELDGTKIYGKTIVPDTINVVNSKLESEGYIINRVRYDSRFVYGALWEFNYISADNFHSVVPDNSVEETIINVRTQDIPEQYQTNYTGSRIYVFDKFYRKYFETKGNNSDSLFSNVITPNWNIASNQPQVIGLFIGSYRSQRINTR